MSSMQVPLTSEVETPGPTTTYSESILMDCPCKVQIFAFSIRNSTRNFLKIFQIVLVGVTAFSQEQFYLIAPTKYI